jgi:hypothetical protein
LGKAFEIAAIIIGMIILDLLEIEKLRYLVDLKE